MIGTLQRVALREVWKHEAIDFTRWLEENIDVISDRTARRSDRAGGPAFYPDLPPQLAATAG